MLSSQLGTRRRHSRSGGLRRIAGSAGHVACGWATRGVAGGHQDGRVGLRADSLSPTDLGVLTKQTNHSPKGGFLQMGVRSKGVNNLGQDSVGTSDPGTTAIRGC